MQLNSFLSKEKSFNLSATSEIFFKGDLLYFYKRDEEQTIFGRFVKIFSINQDPILLKTYKIFSVNFQWKLITFVTHVSIFPISKQPSFLQKGQFSVISQYFEFFRIDTKSLWYLMLLLFVKVQRTSWAKRLRLS